MEYLDIFNEKMEKIEIASRDEAHEKGLLHQTFHCWLVFQEDGKDFILFQKRQSTKKTFPNALDVTAAGHLLAGESVEDGLRELQEELGIQAKMDELCPIGIIREDSEMNREFCHVFLYIPQEPFHQFILQEEEVAGIVKAEIIEMEKLIKGETSSISVSGFMDDQDGRHTVSFTVTKDDFVPHYDSYYLTVLSESKKLLEKKRFD